MGVYVHDTFGVIDYPPAFDALRKVKDVLDKRGREVSFQRNAPRVISGE
jgi:hypothetical protein